MREMPCWFLVTIISTALWSVQRTTAYPQEAQDTTSADTQFSLYNVNTDGDPPNHELWLLNRDSGEKQKVLAYSRHVTVGWAPAGHAFFITNYDGSDSATCMVGIVARTINITDVSRLLGSRTRGRLMRAKPGDHLYCEIVRWISKSEILLRVHGYNEHQRKISEQYRYDIRTEVCQRVNGRGADL